VGGQHPHRDGGQEEQGQPLRPPPRPALCSPSTSPIISELEAKKAELDATIKGATASDEEDEEEEAEEQLSETEVKALKKELSAVKKKLKSKEGNFTKRLKEARAALDEDGAKELALGILRADLDAILGRYVADHRQEIVAAFESWWEKYRTTLTSIEEERDAAAGRLRGFLEGLGYAH
jgi:type I restriction enzyme M protein